MIHNLKIKNDSFLVRLDPRSKIIFTALYVINVLIVSPPNLPGLFLILLILISMIFSSGNMVSFYVRKVLKLYPMIFFTTFLLPFSSIIINDRVLFNIGQISIYESGIFRFLDFNIKSILILTSTIILTSTTPYSLLLKCLENMKMPHWLISVLTILFRFIFLLSSEMERMQLAYKSRYIQMPYLKKIKNYGQMLAVYANRVIERNDRTFQAMISRGFSGEIHIMTVLTWKLNDSLIIITGLIFTTMMILWK